MIHVTAWLIRVLEFGRYLESGLYAASKGREANLTQQSQTDVRKCLEPSARPDNARLQIIKGGKPYHIMLMGMSSSLLV